jgi:hypothetical protein
MKPTNKEMEQMERLQKEWLKKNKPKVYDQCVVKYSLRMTKTQSKEGTQRGFND